MSGYGPDGTLSIHDLPEGEQEAIREAGWMQLHGECQSCGSPLCFSGCCNRNTRVTKRHEDHFDRRTVVAGDVAALEKHGVQFCKAARCQDACREDLAWVAEVAARAAGAADGG